MRLVVFLVALLAAGPGFAQNWQESARGAQTRQAPMDAPRPHAQWMLGSPIEFVVYDLRQSGKLAFASVHPQRSGGGEINLREMPGFERGE